MQNSNSINSNKIKELKILTSEEGKIASGNEIANIFRSKTFETLLVFIIGLAVLLCIIFFVPEVNKAVCGCFQSADDFEGDIHNCLTCDCLKV